jgi:hypothetical protein
MNGLIREGLSAPITGGGPDENGTRSEPDVSRGGARGSRDAVTEGRGYALAFVAGGQAPKEAATGRLL